MTSTTSAMFLALMIIVLGIYLGEKFYLISILLAVVLVVLIQISKSEPKRMPRAAAPAAPAAPAPIVVKLSLGDKRHPIWMANAPKPGSESAARFVATTGALLGLTVKKILRAFK